MTRRPPISTPFPARRSSDLTRLNSSHTLISYAVFVTGVQTCADRKSTRLNSSHTLISYDVFCLKKKKIHRRELRRAACIDAAQARVHQRVIDGLRKLFV